MGFFDPALTGLDRFSAFQRRRELRRLRRKLWREENLVRLLDGRAEGQAGILALTTQRVLWVPEGRLRAVRVLPLREVRTLRAAVAREGAVVAVETEGIAVAVQAEADAAAGFAAEARTIAQQEGNTHLRVRTDDTRPAPDMGMSQEALEAKMSRLARMHARGSMTSEEYRIAQEQLLRQGGPGAAAGPEGRKGPGAGGRPPPDPPSGSWWRRY